MRISNIGTQIIIEWHDKIAEQRANRLEHENDLIRRTRELPRYVWLEPLQNLPKEYRKLMRLYNRYRSLYRKTDLTICMLYNEQLSTIEQFYREHLRLISISERAKRILIDKAKLYDAALIPEIHNQNERLKTAIYLACDKYLCAIPRRIPQPKMVHLTPARKKLGIKPILSGLDRVNSIGKMLGCTEIQIEEAEKLIRTYYTYQTNLSIISPSIIATAALTIIFKKINSPAGIAREVGCTTHTLRRYITEILPYQSLKGKELNLFEEQLLM